MEEFCLTKLFLETYRVCVCVVFRTHRDTLDYYRDVHWYVPQQVKKYRYLHIHIYI